MQTVDAKSIKVGDKIKVEFEIEVDSIRKSNHKDGSIVFGGWIKERRFNKMKMEDDDAFLELISVPQEVVTAIL